MAAGRPTDRYSNIASIGVTQSAANSITFAELLTGISLGQGIGMVIDQIDYYIDTVLVDMILNTDRIAVAWTVSSAPPSLLLSSAVADSRIIHLATMAEPADGVANNSNTNPMIFPISFQFFPGLIVASPRLFFGIHSTGFTGNRSAQSRLYFRYLDLTSQEYLELAEAFILVG